MLKVKWTLSLQVMFVREPTLQEEVALLHKDGWQRQPGDARIRGGVCRFDGNSQRSKSDLNLDLINYWSITKERECEVAGYAVAGCLSSHESARKSTKEQEYFVNVFIRIYVVSHSRLSSRVAIIIYTYKYFLAWLPYHIYCIHASC